MNQIDYDFIVGGLKEGYKLIGQTLTYFKHDKQKDTKDKTGKVTLGFESIGYSISGMFTNSTSLTSDINSAITSRFDGVIIFVVSDLLKLGYSIEKNDKIIFTNRFGTKKEFIITGFDDQVELPDIQIKVLVTDINNIARI